MTSVTHLTNQSQFVQANAVFNGTNISGTIASNGISLSVAPGGGGADGYNILAAGTQTANTTGTVAFSNSNGITFGMSNNSVITASHNGLTTAMASNRGSDFVQATAAFAGTNATGTIASNGISVSVAPQTAFVFSNSNGVTFGTNGSTVTATVATNYQSQGAYLTTARASNDAIGLNSAFTAGPLAMTINSSGLSLNAVSAAGTTSGFAGNLISGSMTHNTAGLNLSLNHPAWLTTAMQSNAATISNINISAGTTSTNASAFTFNNANGITFGLGTGASVGSITASHNGLTSQSNQNITAANGGFAFQTLSFSNLNGISFGTSAGSAITASHNGLTTARASNDAIGLNTAQSNVTWTVNSSGISFDARGYAGTGTTFNGANLSGSMTVNSNGVQLSMSAAAPGGGAAVTVSASNGSFTVGNLNFSNANNVTFGTSAGSIITASVAAPGAAAENNWVNLLGANTAGNTTASGSTIGYSGINLTLSGTNGSIVNISAPPVSSIVGASGISISTNGSTISVGKVLQSTYVPYMAYSTNSQTLAALGATSGSARFFPIFISDNIAFNALRVMHNLSYATSSVSGQQSLTYGYGLFSNNAGTLSSISSGSFSLAVTNSSVSNTVSYPVSTGTAGYTYTTLAQTTTANIQSFWGTAAGGRPLDLQFGNSMTLSSGQYWLGVNLRHSSSSANIGVSIAIGGNANALNNSLAPWGVASSDQTTNSRYRVPYHGLGAYTVSQSSLPNGVPLTQIAHTQTVMPLISFLST